VSNRVQHCFADTTAGGLVFKGSSVAKGSAREKK